MKKKLSKYLLNMLNITISNKKLYFDEIETSLENNKCKKQSNFK